MSEGYKIARNVRDIECETAHQDLYSMNCWLRDWDYWAELHPKERRSKPTIRDPDIEYRSDKITRFKYVDEIVIADGLITSKFELKKVNLKDARENLKYSFDHKGIDCMFGKLSGKNVMLCGGNKSMKSWDEVIFNLRPPRNTPIR